MEKKKQQPIATFEPETGVLIILTCYQPPSCPNLLDKVDYFWKDWKGEWDEPVT